MPLCANVHPHLTYLLLFSFSQLAVYLNVWWEYGSFLSHYWITVLWWVNDVAVGVLLKCFAPTSFGRERLIRPSRPPGLLIRANEISSIRHSMDIHGQIAGIPASNDSSTASCTQNHSPSFSGREALASGDEPLVILQINVEGLTAAKRELIEIKATVALIQETHQTMIDWPT